MTAPATVSDKKTTDASATSKDDVTKLVVQSIGTASFSIVAALRQISTLTEQELAERLFRAPAELFSDVPRETANKAAGILRDAGLDAPRHVPEEISTPWADQ